MINVSLFGETRVTDGDRRLGPRDLAGVKPRQVLEYLALNLGQPVSKSRLVDVLWPDGAPDGAIPTLEAYVSVLRRAIQPKTPARQSVIRTIHGGYCLDADAVTVDLHEFNRLLQDAASSGTPCAVLRTALTLAEGELLASEGDATWAEHARADVRHDLVQACTLAALRALAAGDHEDAITSARRVLAMDPYAEEAARCLVEALWRAGRRGEALREYDRLRTTLVEELGIEPSAPTRALYLQVLQDEEVAPARPVVAAPSAGDLDQEFVMELVKVLLDAVRTSGPDRTRAVIETLSRELVAAA